MYPDEVSRSTSFDRRRRRRRRKQHGRAYHEGWNLNFKFLSTKSTTSCDFSNHFGLFRQSGSLSINLVPSFINGGSIESSMPFKLDILPTFFLLFRVAVGNDIFLKRSPIPNRELVITQQPPPHILEMAQREFINIARRLHARSAVGHDRPASPTSKQK